MEEDNIINMTLTGKEKQKLMHETSAEIVSLIYENYKFFSIGDVLGILEASKLYFIEELIKKKYRGEKKWKILKKFRILKKK